MVQVHSVSYFIKKTLFKTQMQTKTRVYYIYRGLWTSITLMLFRFSCSNLLHSSVKTSLNIGVMLWEFAPIQPQVRLGFDVKEA